MSQFQTPADWNVTSISAIFQLSSNDSSALETTYHITDVRNSITALFVVLNTSLALIGGAFIKSKARRRVATGHAVTVPELTPWLSLSDMAKYAWSLRIFPGGWFGALMLFTGVVGVLHQFLTNTLVTPALIPTRCIFDYGCVPPNGTSPGPASNDDKVYWSQLATLQNGGVRGIYKRFFAPNMIQMFRPDAADTYGAWHCTNVRNDSVPWTGHSSFYDPPSGITPEDLKKYMATDAYLFPDGPWSMTGGTVTNTTTGIAYESSFLIMGSSSDEYMTDVRVSVMNLGLFVGMPVKAMQYHCTVSLTSPDMPAVPYMNVSSVLQNWVSPAYGHIFEQLTQKDTLAWVELTLDAITTESIFNDNINPTDQVPAGEIGCVVQGTNISIAIVFILSLIAAIVLCLVAAQCYFLLASIKLPVKQHADQLPFDLADWQLATYYLGQRQAHSHRELRTIKFRYDDATDKLSMGSGLTLNPNTDGPEIRKHGSVEFDSAGRSFSDNQLLRSHRKNGVQSYVQVPSATEL